MHCAVVRDAYIVMQLQRCSEHVPLYLHTSHSFQLLFPVLRSACWPSVDLPVSQAAFLSDVVLCSVIDHEQDADILHPHMLIPTADFGGALDSSDAHCVVLCIVR
jgi:hypothetical protein